MSGKGAQSPTSDDPQKQLGHSKPGQEASDQLTDAQQRHEQSGKETPKNEPGQAGGVSSEAVKVAQASAEAIGSEAGKSRKDIETGNN